MLKEVNRWGRFWLSFFAGTTIVTVGCVLMNRDSFLAHRDVGWARVNPRSGVVVADAVALQLHWQMRVPAENVVNASGHGVSQRSFSNSCRQAQPSGVE